MKSTTSKPRCATCPCYDRDKWGFGWRKDGETVYLQTAKGACRARPPEILRVGRLAEVQDGVEWDLCESGWPHVTAKDWCAEHPRFDSAFCSSCTPNKPTPPAVPSNGRTTATRGAS